jgi:protein OS-9
MYMYTILQSDVLHIPVLSKHGQLYSCTLPPLMKEEDGEGEPFFETLPNVTSLLEPLSQQECLIKTVGWWTYEYCHGKFVRQYHMEAGKLVGETKYLGFYERETQWDEQHIARVKGLLDSFRDNLVGSKTTAFHSVYYVNGTECDITRQPRSARVELHCTLEGVDKMIEVKEDSTCNYTLTVQTPLLCQHPMLIPLGNSAPSHTLSCAPVVSQLDYEDYLLKQELIKQQKEKLSSLQSSSDRDREEEEEEESLMIGSHQLLRKLVMSSITQLAEIAYDIGSLEDIELDLDEIDEDDKEVGASSLKRDSGSDEDGEMVKEGASAGVRDRGQGAENKELSQDDQKASDKMKKMADQVKNTGRDDALQSLLANLAVTAQYIESLESTGNDAKPSDQDNTVPEEASDQFETGEPGHGDQERHEHTPASSDMSVKGPPPTDSRGKGRTGSSEEHKSNHGEYRSTRGSVSEEFLAADLEEEEEVVEEELDSELVREMEHHLEETLAKQLNTNDVTVKIVTLPLREGEGEEGASDGTSAETDSELSATMSRLIEALLSGEEPVSADRQKQSDLEANYDHVWGKEKNDRRRTSI